MRFTSTVLASLTAATVIGCTKDNPRELTAPPPSLRMVIAGAACSAAQKAQVDQEMGQLFAGATLTQAQAKFQPVVNLCVSNLAQAREEMLTYVQFTIDMLTAGNIQQPNPANFPSKRKALVSHWNSVFSYVGHPEPNISNTALGDLGAARVITQSSVNRELNAATAAMTIPVQLGNGDQRGHLFTIAPLSAGCLTASNLPQTGPCFEFSANPKVSPVFDPKVKVGICQPVAANQSIQGLLPALGHLENGSTQVAQVPGAPYPTFCVDSPPVAGSWTGGFGEFAKRLAWVTERTLGVKSLFAAHGGLGGVSGGLSPFGGVDLMLFKASFNSAVGSPPSGPSAGTWTHRVTPPGSILVQQSLGDLTDKPVVMKQANSPCSPCFALYFSGRLTGANGLFPTDGIYVISWLSLQSQPTITAAPFILRSSNERIIARLSYVSNNQLLYNGSVVGSWVQNKKQKFDVTVNLYNKTTSLSIDGVVVAQNIPFVGPALNLAFLAAEFASGYAGTVGWDDISILRLPDP